MISRRIATRALLSTLLLSLLGCEVQQETSQYPVVFRSATEQGDVVTGVKVTVAGQVLGATDANGLLQVTLTGAEGDRPQIEATCPVGTTTSGQIPLLLLRHVEGPSAELGAEVMLRCEPDKRVAALLVSAPGFAGLPVLVHGQEVARTDASGIAHVALDGAPRTPLRVVLDTSARPHVEPASPHKDLRIGARDEIVVFAPELTEVLPKAPRKHKQKIEPVVVEEKIVRPERL